MRALRQWNRSPGYLVQDKGSITGSPTSVITPSVTSVIGGSSIYAHGWPGIKSTPRALRGRSGRHRVGSRAGLNHVAPRTVTDLV